MKISPRFIAVMALLATKSALAAVAAPTGFYVEGNVGKSYAHDSYAGPSVITNIDNDGTGFNISGGYKFMPYLAAELGYTYYAYSNINGQSGEIGKDHHYAVDAAAKGILPIGDSGFDLFGKLGLADVHSDLGGSFFQHASDGNAISPYVGAGAEYAITSNILANVQWDHAKGNSSTGSLDLASVGLSYLF